ncbi:MAG: hypothetical protein ACE15F_15225 [bacterium]
MTRLFPWLWLMVLVEMPGQGAPAEPVFTSTYQVSPAGTDHFDADGQSRPWQSLGYALSRIPDTGGVEIVVQPGTYPALSSTRRFERKVTIRAAVPRESILLPGPDQGPVLLTGAHNLRLEGFVIDNRANPAVSNALQILAGSSAIEVVNCRVTHGGPGHVSADAVKIHQQVSRIRLEGNEIFDANDEEVEIGDWAHDIVLRRNVIYRRRSSSREALVAIQERAWRIVLDRNVIVNMNPESGSPLLRLGSGLEKQEETSELLLLNNAFIHRASAPVIALTGCVRAMFAGNLFFTQAGHDPVLCPWIPYPGLNRPPEIGQVFLWGNRISTSASNTEVTGVAPALLENGSVIRLDSGGSQLPSPVSGPDHVPAGLEEVERILLENPPMEWLNFLLPNPGIQESETPPFRDHPGLPETLRTFCEEYIRNG